MLDVPVDGRGEKVLGVEGCLYRRSGHSKQSELDCHKLLVPLRGFQVDMIHGLELCGIESSH